MEVECKSTPDLDRVDSKTSATAKRVSPLQSPCPPLPSASDLHSAASTAVKQEPVPRPKPDDNADLSTSMSMPVPTSQPLPTARQKPCPLDPPSHRQASAKAAPAATFKTTAQPGNTKENFAPMPSSKTADGHSAGAKRAEGETFLTLEFDERAAGSSAFECGEAECEFERARMGEKLVWIAIEAAKARLAARKVSRLEGS